MAFGSLAEHRAAPRTLDLHEEGAPPSERTGQTLWDLELVDCQCLPIPIGLDEGMCHPWENYNIDEDLLCLVLPHPTFLFFFIQKLPVHPLYLWGTFVCLHIWPTPNNKAFTSPDVQ